MVTAGLFFAAVILVAVVVGLIVLVVALCKAACRGDGQEDCDPQHRSRVGLSEGDVSLCQSRQRPHLGVTVMAGACGLTPDLSSKRGRGVEMSDRTTGERQFPDER
jgi:hypothetical protein